MKRWEKIFENVNQKHAGQVILTTEKLDFKPKTLSRDNGHYTMIKASIDQRYTNYKYIYMQHQST